MQTTLLDHLRKYDILTKEQYGFRKKLTTKNATCNLINEILMG